jgi:hypothetical protein
MSDVSRSVKNKQEQSREQIEIQDYDLLEQIQDNEEEIGPIDDDVEEDFDQKNESPKIISE